MQPLASSPTQSSARSRAALVTLTGAIVLAACSSDNSLGGAGHHDAAPDTEDAPGIVSPDTSADLASAPIDRPAESAACSQYPATPRFQSDGTSWWKWYLHWDTGRDVEAFCGSYGAGAKMVVEVDYPHNPMPSTTLPSCTSEEVLGPASRACAIDKAYRFELPCTTGELLLELPSETAFHGYYHIESAEVATVSRHLVNQDVHCTRDLYITAPSYGPVDAGATPGDASDDAVCASPGSWAYEGPGCGVDAKRVCHQSAADTATIGIYYCGCDGKTVMSGVGAASQPYQFQGCCPGDSGFGPLGSYTCPADGGLPYLTPWRDGGASETGTTEAGMIEAGATEAGPLCAPAGASIPAGGSCSPTVTHCPSAWSGECWNGALMQAATGSLWACGARCGDLALGFSDGCATVVVETEPPFVTNGSTRETMMDCVRSYLFATRFDCVPRDGWVTLHVDGCSLP